MLDRKTFYASVRSSLFGTLSQSQVDGMEVLLDEGEERDIDSRWLAYILGTAYHEVARTMEPIAEYGKGKGKPYYPYYGRGFVQLTWRDNYKKMGDKLSPPVNLVNKKERALELEIATQVIFIGMIDGDFSKDKKGRPHSLPRYFNDEISDWYNARRIVNLLDKAGTISGYAQKFYKALLEADAARVAEFRREFRTMENLLAADAERDERLDADFSVAQEAIFVLENNEL